MRLLSLLWALSLIGVIPCPESVQLSNEASDPCSVTRIRYVRDASLGPEAYEIRIRRRHVVVRSSDDAGRFYAQKTLGQLIRAGEMHPGTIKDRPRFPWRGFMLDEARHFHGKERVKQLLDIMAEYKLNRFHWHLSDNQGWRIEIKAYPALTETGAIGCYSDSKAPAQYYTQEDIKEIVEYASERFIEIIPEIDMPGHFGAAARSLPGIQGGDGTLNPASEETYTVLGAVIRELCMLFPGRWFHIGGDEVHSKAWPSIPEVAELMAREHLETVPEVQGWFGRRIADTVRFYGKTIAGWDDIAEYGLSSDQALVMWWQARRPGDLDRDVAAGYPTVICPERPFYLDYCQETWHKYGFASWKGRFNRLEELYRFPLKEDPHVCGVQSNLWTEFVHNADRLDYMAFPRLIALAEKAWTREENMNYEDFLRRLDSAYEYLDSLGIKYYDARNPDRHPEPFCPGIPK